jgi:DNA-directed RNA polymerase specialized sigma24 family protein
MTNRTAPTHDHASSLIDLAARRGVPVSLTGARTLARLGNDRAQRRLDAVCQVVEASRENGRELTFSRAARRIDNCHGDVDEAIRRLLNGGAENQPGVSDAVQYAAERGVTLAPTSIQALFVKHGRQGTRGYIDKLGQIMDTASMLGISCNQALATRRLALAKGNVQHVVANLTAQHRRRSDRRSMKCQVLAPPEELAERANAFARCGCPRCVDRLANQMQRYIERMISGPFFAHLDREEARSESNLELIKSIETWPGAGNFAGWFAAHFKNRTLNIYGSRSPEEQEMLSLDATDISVDDAGGLTTPLGERIPDRSSDVLTIVLLRERLAEAALQQHQLRADKANEHTTRARISCIPPRPRPQRLFLVGVTTIGPGAISRTVRRRGLETPLRTVDPANRPRPCEQSRARPTQPNYRPLAPSEW